MELCKVPERAWIHIWVRVEVIYGPMRGGDGFWDGLVALTGIDILIRCLVSAGHFIPRDIIGRGQKSSWGEVLGSLLACRQRCHLGATFQRCECCFPSTSPGTPANCRRHGSHPGTFWHWGRPCLLSEAWFPTKTPGELEWSRAPGQQDCLHPSTHLRGESLPHSDHGFFQEEGCPIR